MRAAATAAALLLLFCRAAAAQPVEPSCFQARFLDVGQGDAAIVRAASGESMLVDAGPRDAGDRVVDAARRHGGAPSIIVFTHPHADHVGGHRPVIEAFRTSRILDAGFAFGSQVYRSLLRTLLAQRRSLEVARRGQRFPLGPRVQVQVLAPSEPLFNRSRSNANANSVVLKVACGRVAMLFAGDAERETEGRLVAGGDLAAQVLKVAHHGSRYASTEQFLMAVRPSIAVISCGRRNRYGHPAQSTLERLARVGAAVHRTDLEGDVIVRSDGERVEASSEGVRPGPSASP